MSPEQLHVYTEEVMLHTLVAQREFGRLMELLVDPEERQRREVWIVLQAFLAHVGMVSKFFFPATRDPLSVQRGKTLREHLNVAEGAALVGRTARNAFEHLDERMDNWLRTDKAGILESVFPDEAALRYFSAERWAIRRVLILEPLQFVSEERGGRTFTLLAPLVRELEQLRRCCATRIASDDPHHYVGPR
ncbi:hypothetical protein ACR80S_13330 [Halomonas sp. MA07-2]|uniref:hypothetical protein n=1 Tax=Halomonas sp. MA07-2 TaxID=3440841 RepID=UPI003EF0671E